MVKKIFLSLGLTSLLVSGLMACHPQGCTPGFWKTGNHIVGFQSEEYAEVFLLDEAAELKVNAMVGDVNGKAYDKLEGMTEDEVLELGEALWLEGNKGDEDGDKFLQLVRSSTAALLNIRALNWYVQYPGSAWMTENVLIELVQGALAGTGDMTAEELHKMLDDANNQIDYVGDNYVCPE